MQQRVGSRSYIGKAEWSQKYLDGYLKNIIEFVYIDRNVTESSGDCIPCMAHGVSTVPSMRRVTSDTQSWERFVVLGLASN